MPKDNQVRFRVDPCLLTPLADAAAAHGMDVQELMRTVTRYLLLTGPDYSFIGEIERETKDVQALLDQEIARIQRSGVRKKSRDSAAWVQEKIEDARFRILEGRSIGQRYFVLLRGRALGPHRLDKLREWFALDILPGETEVKGAKTGTTCLLKSIPKFKDYSPLLKRKLGGLKKEPRPDWWHLPPTDAQLKRLEFFDLPYEKAGLTRGRASMLIAHFAFLDPKKEEQYQTGGVGAN